MAASRSASNATIRAGIIVPAGAINPLTIEDQGGLELLGNVGEFLVLADQQLGYQPWLATSWTVNANATVWTFKIRQNAKFNDGTPDDYRRRRLQLQEPVRPEERRQRPHELLRDPASPTVSSKSTTRRSPFTSSRPMPPSSTLSRATTTP